MLLFGSMIGCVMRFEVLTCSAPNLATVLRTLLHDCGDFCIVIVKDVMQQEDGALYGRQLLQKTQKGEESASERSAIPVRLVSSMVTRGSGSQIPT